ncbi:hypothetical protein FGLOB1_12956 [Fusarium globosum]|uniref:Uncharacterized protein n=1 Tax=Fusarium globosum TaxID=78864 RepID=A0A8H5XPL3_9HYPO|nr:hypothetical protein FGLOB1_12956 [Fusarium globosum]
MEPDDHESSSSSSSFASSFASSSDACCLPSPSSLKSTATSSRKVSPPELKPESPRTRPRPSRLPAALADFKDKSDAAGEVGAWTVLPLSNEDHTNYLEQIEATFRRFDYDPRKGYIAIRMPGLVHESFIREFDFRLRIQLKSLGLEHQNTITGDFINKIRSNGSADIELITTDSSNVPYAKRLTRSPDSSFVHKDAGLSGVVVEVAYSQDGKKLPGLARDYLLRSYGKIKAVIGFDLNRENKTSTVTVYKVLKTPSDNGRIKLGVEAVVHESTFHTAEKTPADGELTLLLHDFADDKRYEGVENLRVSIPYSELSTILDEAEERFPLIRIDSEEAKSVDLESTPSKPDEDLYPEELTEGQKPKRLATQQAVDEPAPNNDG